MRKIPPVLGLPPSESTNASADRIRMVIPLKLITPMIGGGVNASEINREQPVRAASVRGLLRFWWRAMQMDAKDTEELYERECRIWGGQIPDSSERKGKALKGRVAVHIAPISEGDFNIKVAGIYKYDSTKGRYGGHRLNLSSPMPSSFLYALFPLQHTVEDLRSLGKNDGALPLVAMEGEFSVVVDLDGTIKSSRSVESSNPDNEDAQLRADLFSVVSALKVWATLGGIGARTRRGFGSVEIDGDVSSVALSENYNELAASFKTIVEKDIHAENIVKELGLILEQQLLNNRGPINSSPSWPVLGAPPELLLGEQSKSPNLAIGQLLEKSLSFYQRSPDGRFRSNNPKKKEGVSRWPEPDVMKYSYAYVNNGRSIEFGHKPTRTEQSELSAPRAARGMPLRVVFIGNRADKQADGELLPVNGDRLPSPLIFRAIKSQKGQYKALVLRLKSPEIDKVRVKLDNDSSTGPAMTIPVKSASTIKTDNGSDLCKKGEDAVTAFITYLRKSKEFT